jgi:hypothetical protein
MAVESLSESQTYLKQQAENIVDSLELESKQKEAVQKTVLETIANSPPQEGETFKTWFTRTKPEFGKIADSNQDKLEEGLAANWEKISEHAHKLSIKRETIGGTSELKREMIDTKNPDGQLLESINAFDVEKSISEQSEKFENMRPAIYAIFAGIFQNGTPLSKVQNLQDISSLEFDESTLINPIERVAWRKLLEISKKTDSRAFKDLNTAWSEFTQRAYAQYGKSDAVGKDLTGEPREKKDEKEEGFIEKTVQFAKDHPVITSVVLLAGAYGLYRLFKKSDDKKEEKESSSKWPWIFGGGMALTLFLTGKLFGVDNCLTWIMEKFNVSEEKRDRFKKLWNEEKYVDAFQTLFEDDVNEEAWKFIEKKTAEEGAKIDADALQKVADTKYDDFMSTANEAKNMAENAAGNIEGMSGVIAGTLTDPKQAKEEIKIRNYLRQNADKIKALNLPENATIGEILAALHGVTLKKKPKEEKENFSNKKHLWEVIWKYPTYTNIMQNWESFRDEMVGACKKDDLNIIVGGGIVFVTDGIIAIPLLIGEAWCDIFEPGEYLKDSSIFIVGAAVKEVLKAKGLGKIPALIKGAAQGAIFPIKAPFIAASGTAKAIYRGGKRIEEARGMVKGEKFRAQRIINGNVPIEAETRFYGELAKKYDDAHEALQHSEWSKRKFFAKLDSERNEKLRLKYMKKFAEAYSRQFPDKKIIVDETDLKDTLRKTKDVMHEYLKKPVPLAVTAPTASSAQAIPESSANTSPNLMEQAPQEPLVYKPKVTFIETTLENGAKTHRYTLEGKNITLTETDIGRRAAEIGKRVGAKPNLSTNWNRAIEELAAEKMASATAINGSRWQNGRLEIQIGEEWQAAEAPKTLEARATLKQKFAEALEKTKIKTNIDAFIDGSKTVKFFGVLERILGPTAAALTIYHLETAEDKQQAVAETAGALGGFIAGMRLADWTVGKRTTNPAARAVIDIAGGFAGAFGLTAPIEKIVTEYMEKIPAGKEVGGEIAHMIELYSGYTIIKKVAYSSAGKAAIEKTAVKMGMKTLGESFTRQFTGNLAKKIGQLAARQGFKSLIKIVGKEAAVAGAAATGILADDATGIGVIDDVLLIPLAIWMGVDITQAALLIRNAYKMNKEMELRQNKDVAFFHINDKSSREALAKKLPEGITVDQLDELDETTFANLLHDLPKTTIDIIRKDTSGRERITMTNGKVIHTAVLDDNFDTICEMDSGDIDSMDSALGIAEKKPKTTSAQIAESPTAPQASNTRRGSI